MSEDDAATAEAASFGCAKGTDDYDRALLHR